MVFQFLMVQLKADYGASGGEYVNRFQFLMVQLKVQSDFEWWPIFIISIPYGSIKSAMFDDVANNFVGISIPYGSIKR